MQKLKEKVFNLMFEEDTSSDEGENIEWGKSPKPVTKFGNWHLNGLRPSEEEPLLRDQAKDNKKYGNVGQAPTEKRPISGVIKAVVAVIRDKAGKLDPEYESWVNWLLDSINFTAPEAMFEKWDLFSKLTAKYYGPDYKDHKLISDIIEGREDYKKYCKDKIAGDV